MAHPVDHRIVEHAPDLGIEHRRPGRAPQRLEFAATIASGVVLADRHAQRLQDLGEVGAVVLVEETTAKVVYRQSI